MDQRDREHRADMAKQFDAYREDYKNTLDPLDYPGNLSLIFELDTRVCVVTNDNRTLIGELSSYDTFGNIVLSKCVERDISAGGGLDRQYGIVFIRTEQIIMIGRVDAEKEQRLINEINGVPDDN